MFLKATDGQVFESIESRARSRVKTSLFQQEVTPCPPVLRSSHSEYELRRKAAQGVTSRWNDEVSTRLRTDDSMISKTCPSVALGTTRCVPWDALVACFFQPVRGGSKQKITISGAYRGRTMPLFRFMLATTQSRPQTSQPRAP